MIQEVTMYQAVCDRCGKGHVDEFNGYVAWSDTLSAKNVAMDAGWQEMDGKLYCPDCVEYDEETDSYKPKRRMAMERKIGEIFEYNGEWYQCVEESLEDCTGCDMFRSDRTCTFPVGKCYSLDRKDNTGVIFKKLRPVGDPFACNYFGDKRPLVAQKYRLHHVPAILPDIPHVYSDDGNETTVAIEIKQNKQDEKDMEEKELNLKPFDLEAAKAGKPVCTRNGRKARIICFDIINKGNYPIIAVIEDSGYEAVFYYNEEGKAKIGDTFDLMMLPEKHEGWVNVFNHGNNDTYVGNFIFPTEELAKEALSRMDGVKYIATVKIQWEE